MSHFSRPLSPVQKWQSNAIVKARLKLRIVASMTDGGYHGGGYHSRWAGIPIIVKVGDIEKVHSYARQHASLRDFMLLHLPYAEGLRTGEICTLEPKHIDFDHGTFYVFDSKQKALCSYPIPLDMVTLQLLEDLLDGRREGYLFERQRSWKYAKANEPLTVQEVWHVVRKLGQEAGVEGFKPRHLRERFAYDWACVQQKNLVTLKLILRHESLETTQIYIQKLYPWEKMREDFDAKRNSPFVVPRETGKALNNHMDRNGCLNTTRRVPFDVPDFSASICKDCGIVNVCKFAPLPECAEGCRFKPKIKEETKR